MELESELRSAPLYVIQDSREQRPWGFDGYPVIVDVGTLTTGDYSIKSACRYDDAADRFDPVFAIERKAPADFVASITSNRQRFRRLLRRASTWPLPLVVIVEAPWNRFENEAGCMQWRDVSFSQVSGTISSWVDVYNVSVHFVEGRRDAQLLAYVLLSVVHRAGVSPASRTSCLEWFVLRATIQANGLHRNQSATQLQPPIDTRQFRITELKPETVTVGFENGDGPNTIHRKNFEQLAGRIAREVGQFDLNRIPKSEEEFICLLAIHPAYSVDMSRYTVQRTGVDTLGCIVDELALPVATRHFPDDTVPHEE